MKAILMFLFVLVAMPAGWSQKFAGQYTGEFNGDPVQITLEAAGAGKWAGEMNDSHQAYKIIATNQGNELSGSANCEAMGISFELSGRLNGEVLDLKLVTFGVELPVVLTKTGGQPAAVPAVSPDGSAGPMPKLPAHARYDPALVGAWVRQENYNSGSGMDGYYSNNTYLAFNADGTLTDLGSQTMAGSNAIKEVALV